MTIRDINDKKIQVGDTVVTSTLTRGKAFLRQGVVVEIQERKNGRYRIKRLKIRTQAPSTLYRFDRECVLVEKGDKYDPES